MYNFDMFDRWMGGFAWAPLAIVLVLWGIFWKGLGLWHAARRGQGWWFLAMLLLNTLGILEVIYLFAVAKVKSSELIPSGKK